MASIKREIKRIDESLKQTATIKNDWARENLTAIYKKQRAEAAMKIGKK